MCDTNLCGGSWTCVLLCLAVRHEASIVFVCNIVQCDWCRGTSVGGQSCGLCNPRNVLAAGMASSFMVGDRISLPTSQAVDCGTVRYGRCVATFGPDRVHVSLCLCGVGTCSVLPLAQVCWEDRVQEWGLDWDRWVVGVPLLKIGWHAVNDNALCRPTSHTTELDAAWGLNDGSIDGVRYFSCPPFTGRFVRPCKVKLFRRGGALCVTNEKRTEEPSQVSSEHMCDGKHGEEKEEKLSSPPCVPCAPVEQHGEKEEPTSHIEASSMPHVRGLDVRKPASSNNSQSWALIPSPTKSKPQLQQHQQLPRRPLSACAGGRSRKIAGQPGVKVHRWSV